MPCLRFIGDKSNKPKLTTENTWHPGIFDEASQDRSESLANDDVIKIKHKESEHT